MRTSHLACIALVVMLFATTTCLGDTFANAYADDTTPYEYDPDGFAFSRWAWAPGTYNWSFSITAHASAAIRGTDGTGSSAEGSASVFVLVAGGAAGDAAAYASVAGEITAYEQNDDDSGSGSVYMDQQGEVLYCGESSSATAKCGSAFSHAHARGQTSASASIWQ